MFGFISKLKWGGRLAAIAGVAIIALQASTIIVLNERLTRLSDQMSAVGDAVLGEWEGDTSPVETIANQSNDAATDAAEAVTILQEMQDRGVRCID